MAMNVTEPASSGLTKAYRSVASICGSMLVSGASRWLEAAHPEQGPGAGLQSHYGRHEARRVVV